jgi:hypothetical protein
MFKRLVIPSSNSKPPVLGSAVDIAARYLVYKLYSATDGRPGAWHALEELREKRATADRAVERGWVDVREDQDSGVKLRRAALTDAGRLVARKALRG